jgi:hypothetical protein
MANKACCVCGGGKRPSSQPSISFLRKQSKSVKGTNIEGGSSVYGSHIDWMAFEFFSIMNESMSIGEFSKEP